MMGRWRQIGVPKFLDATPPKRSMMQFASDNTAPVAPAILAAIGQANLGFAPGYGADQVSARVMERFALLFEHEVACFLVATGTAANALAVAHLAPPWGAVLCHEESH